MENKNWFIKLFSADLEASSKRFAFVILVIVYIVQHFLLMYLPIEIKNAGLVEKSQDGIYWLIVVLGGLIGAEPVLNKFRFGGPKVVNVENVDKQNIKTDTVTTTGEKKDEILQ